MRIGLLQAMSRGNAGDQPLRPDRFDIDLGTLSEVLAAIKINVQTGRRKYQVKIILIRA